MEDQGKPAAASEGSAEPQTDQAADGAPQSSEDPGSERRRRFFARGDSEADKKAEEKRVSAAMKGEAPTLSEIEEKEVSEGAKGAGITAMVVVMVLFIRIMAVSGWDWDTAAELVEAFDFDDAVPIFFGTLFELPVVTGIVAGLVLPLSVYRLYTIQHSKDRLAKVTDWLIILILGLILFVLENSYQMWWPIILATAFSAVIVIFVSLVHKGDVLMLLDKVSRRTGTILVVFLLILSVVVTTPWNIREEIGLQDGVVHGHVIEVTPGFVKVLTDDREVLVLLTSDIKYRKSIEITE